MNESLGELLRRSADAVSEPRLDVGELVAKADRRQRHRRLAVATAAAGVIGAIVVGSLVVRGGHSRNLEPAPAPSPPSSVAVDPAGTRPLVYAEGSTVHVGDGAFDAGGAVRFLDVTDVGVVYATEDGDQPRLWFHDGTTTRAIGRVDRWPGDFYFMSSYVMTAEPGSLLVWADATSRTRGSIDQFVVYDTSRREVVSTIAFTGMDDQLLHVDDGHVYFNPDKSKPGCWILDIQFCDDPHLLRYDLATGKTTKISQASFVAELSTHPRMLATAEADAEVKVSEGGNFKQVGRRLVPVDSGGGATVFTRASGESIQLRLPDGYLAPGNGDGVIGLSQWLDDNRIVLAASDGEGDTGPSHGDLLVCRLPDGVCRVVVSDTEFVAR